MSAAVYPTRPAASTRLRATATRGVSTVTPGIAPISRSRARRSVVVNGDSSRHLIDPTKDTDAGRGHVSTPTRSTSGLLFRGHQPDTWAAPRNRSSVAANLNSASRMSGSIARPRHADQDEAKRSCARSGRPRWISEIPGATSASQSGGTNRRFDIADVPTEVPTPERRVQPDAYRAA